MGIAERKERQRAELRDQILRAAREIVLRDGFDALTMRKIADAIEYSPATIYLHFPSREAIGRELVRSSFAELLAYLSPAQDEPDLLERLRSFGRLYLRFGAERPQAYRLIFMTDPALSGVITQYASSTEPGDRAFNLLARVVRELVERAIFKPVDPLLAAHCCWAGLHGIVSLHLTCGAMTPRSVGVAALGETMLEALIGGLAA